MPSNSVWQQSAEGMRFEGYWNHASVSRYWSELQGKSCSMVDVTEVAAFDSAFLTLLLALSPAHQPLRVEGASAALIALIELYNLTAIFQLSGEARL